MDFNVPGVIIADQETISSAGKTLAEFAGVSAANVLASSRLWLTVNTNAVRIRYDGTAPTTSVGHRLTAGNDVLLSGNTILANFEIIRDGSADAEVFVTLEG